MFGVFKIEQGGGEKFKDEYSEENLKKLSHPELVSVCIYVASLYKKELNKNKQLKNKNEEYKAEITRVNNKAERRKKEATYQRKLITLYKRLLEKLTGCEGDF